MITEADLKELERNYKHAEQKALEQMDIFVQIKTRRENPMNESLKQINSKNRKVIAEQIMTSERSNDVFIKRCFGNELVGERWANGADKEFKSAMRQFNEFYKRYQPKQNKFEFDANKQRLIKMYMQMMLRKMRESHEH